MQINLFQNVMHGIIYLDKTVHRTYCMIVFLSTVNILCHVNMSQCAQAISFWDV